MRLHEPVRLPMPHSSSVTRSSFPVRATRTLLLQCSFFDNFSEHGLDDSDLGVIVGLDLMRVSASVLGVVLRVSTPDDSPYELDVSYAVEYEADETLTEEDRDAAWRALAFNSAPPLLYTYIRELVSNLTSRASHGPMTLPLLPLPIYVPEEEQVIPEAPEDAVYQTGLDLEETTDDDFEVR